ncbi:unnamed protein product (macronuclear) [Paramecium tetraurelia]|uniref:Uncharacterized protein n=1 Tax=Paramecium tetraurelia TaxID=5888 RepID=A0C284_PARTE|nr:uncharacterized protein GSPATT00034378001 [Paramecium tetraurelia]CAK64901.1 unnamed protein product [Paramecium tetraurelia]|eukprot:XP_001432298.1 hypothetical protein (macronuclear) [Paramecium tetraurelia strain d4-2]
MGNDIQRVQQLGDSIRQLREDMDALSKITPQVEKMVALAGTLESTTKNVIESFKYKINENISKVSKTVSDVEDKTKKVKELVDKVPAGMKFF